METRRVDIPAVNVLSICSGAGGLELGVRLAVPESRAVCYCEREAYACAILAARMRGGLLDEAPIWTDVTSFDGNPWRGVVDIIVAGFPCQPFSTMGKRGGRKDKRYIWPHITRIIKESEPSIVFCENVPRLLDLGFDSIRDELRDMGYACEAGVFSAAEVGASHLRKRLFFLAYAKSELSIHRELGQRIRESAGGCDGGVGNEKLSKIFPPWREDVRVWQETLGSNPELKPAFYDVDDELASGLGKPDLANREKQIRVLGNGVVPACAGYAFSILLSRANGI